MLRSKAILPEIEVDTAKGQEVKSVAHNFAWCIAPYYGLSLSLISPVG